MKSQLGFDFITDGQFRNVLTADKEEMYQCLNSESWKAAHVLAGSIIEAVILDYLVAEGHIEKNKALTIDLGSAIQMAEQRGIVSQKISTLSRLVKDYRNLVHPGRAIRTGESPDSNSALIVSRLLEMILAEIGERKRVNYGYTAEQIVTKLTRDPSSMAILRQLLKDVNKIEISRLIIEVIPDRYFSAAVQSEIEETPNHLISLLSALFRTAIEIAPEDTQLKFANQFIRILKEESEWQVSTYCHEFFSMEMLRHLGPNDIRLVKEHYFEQPRSVDTDDKWVQSLKGIGKYLTEQDVPTLLNSLIRRAFHGCSKTRDSIINIFWDLDD